MKELNEPNVAQLVGHLQSCRLINSLEWLKLTATLLTKITGEVHWVEDFTQSNGVPNHRIVPPLLTYRPKPAKLDETF